VELTREAAIQVMLSAASHGLIVTGFESGIWHHSVEKFEARLDGIASTQVKKVTCYDDVVANNIRMVSVLDECIPHDYDVVIVETAPSGYDGQGEVIGELWTVDW